MHGEAAKEIARRVRELIDQAKEADSKAINVRKEDAKKEKSA